MTTASSFPKAASRFCGIRPKPDATFASACDPAASTGGAPGRAAAGTSSRAHLAGGLGGARQRLCGGDGELERQAAWRAASRSELPCAARSSEEFRPMNDLVAPASTKRTGDAPAARERYSYDRGDFTWRWHQDGTWALHVEGRRGAVLDVVRDETHPQMWRIRCPDDRLSDMVNLSRAKDAAITAIAAFLGFGPFPC